MWLVSSWTVFRAVACGRRGLIYGGSVVSSEEIRPPGRVVRRGVMGDWVPVEVRAPRCDFAEVILLVVGGVRAVAGGGATSRELARLLSFGRRRVQRALAALRRRGVVYFVDERLGVGAGRCVRWFARDTKIG